MSVTIIENSCDLLHLCNKTEFDALRFNYIMDVSFGIEEMKFAIRYTYLLLKNRKLDCNLCDYTYCEDDEQYDFKRIYSNPLLPSYLNLDFNKTHFNKRLKAIDFFEVWELYNEYFYSKEIEDFCELHMRKAFLRIKKCIYKFKSKMYLIHKKHIEKQRSNVSRYYSNKYLFRLKMPLEIIDKINEFI